VNYMASTSTAVLLTVPQAQRGLVAPGLFF
jgi:hypothetical protein